MTSPFTQVFTGDPTIPTEYLYKLITLTASVAMVWPLEAETSTNVLPQILDVNPSAGGFNIDLPNATQVSPGQPVIIRNLSASFTFTVRDYTGGVLLTVPVSSVYFFYLQTTSTTAGTWGSFVFGNLSGVINPNSLAGPGLTVVGSTLATAVPVTPRAATWTQSSAGTSRAQLNVYSGGAGTWNLASAPTLGTNYWESVVNQGSGNLTLDPSGAELINGAATLVLAPGEAAVIVCDGTGWYTQSWSRSLTASITLLSLTGLTGGTVALTSVQAQNAIIFFSGTLSSNLKIEFPAVVGRWFMRNATTGAYTSTCAVTGGTDPGALIPQAEQRPILSDGTNIYDAVTTTPIAPTSYGNGLVGSPSIYLTATNTGIYFPVGNVSIAMATGGAQFFLASAAGISVNSLSLVDGSGDIPRARVTTYTLPYEQAAAVSF